MNIELFEAGFALKPYLFSLMLIDSRCRTKNKKIDSAVNAIKRDRQLFKFYIVTITKLIDTHCDLMVVVTKNKEYKNNIYGAYKNLKEIACFNVDGTNYPASICVDGKGFFEYLEDLECTETKSQEDVETEIKN